MEEKKYNFGSPEVQQFLGLSPNVTDPSARQQHIRKLVDRLGLADVPGNYENAFFKQGILPEDLEAIKKYSRLHYKILQMTSGSHLPSQNYLLNRLYEIKYMAHQGNK